MPVSKDLSKKQIREKYNLSCAMVDSLEQDGYIFRTGRTSWKFYNESTFNPEEYRKFFEERSTVKWKRNSSISCKKAYESEKLRKEISCKVKKAFEDDKVKERHRQGLLKAYENPEFRQKVSESSKRMWQKEGFKERQCKLITEALSRPEVKEKQVNNLRKVFQERGEEILQKGYETKIRTQGFNTSKLAEYCKQRLVNLGLTIEEEKKYPGLFRFCDIYIKELDLWVELHFYPTHGNEPFDKNNEKHINWLKVLSTKKSFYKSTIKQWSEIDVQKKTCAETNGLNWVAFYNIEDFITYFCNLGYSQILGDI